MELGVARCGEVPQLCHTIPKNPIPSTNSPTSPQEITNSIITHFINHAELLEKVWLSVYYSVWFVRHRRKPLRATTFLYFGSWVLRTHLIILIEVTVLEPWVSQHFCSSRPPILVNLHSRPQKWNSHWIYRAATTLQIWKRICRFYLLLHLIKRLARVGQLPREQDVDHYCGAPDVDFVAVVGVFLEELWSHVVPGTRRLEFGTCKRRFHCEAEICDANVKIFVALAVTSFVQEKNVF